MNKQTPMSMDKRKKNKARYQQFNCFQPHTTKIHSLRIVGTLDNCAFATVQFPFQVWTSLLSIDFGDESLKKLYDDHLTDRLLHRIKKVRCVQLYVASLCPQPTRWHVHVHSVIVTHTPLPSPQKNSNGLEEESKYIISCPEMFLFGVTTKIVKIKQPRECEPWSGNITSFLRNLTGFFFYLICLLQLQDIRVFELSCKLDLQKYHKNIQDCFTSVLSGVVEQLIQVAIFSIFFIRPFLYIFLQLFPMFMSFPFPVHFVSFFGGL